MSKKHKNRNSITHVIIIILIIIWILVLWYLYKLNMDKQALERYNNNPNKPKPHSEELYNLINMQQEKGTTSIRAIKCDSLKLEESKKYCISQKEMLNSLKIN